jgi:hypothetical protein
MTKLSKRSRKIIKCAAEYISADAQMIFETSVCDGRVDSREAWNYIKLARKLVKQLLAIAEEQKP